MASSTANAIPELRVSILMLAYKAADTIVAAIDGALSQTVPCEIIISDDASADATFELISEHTANYQGPHTLIIRRNAHNLGLSQHLNDLLAMASGDIIVFMAGDDISYPQRITETLQAFDNNPNAYVVGSAWDEVDMQNQLIIRRSRNLPAQFSMAYFANAGRLATVVGATLAIRREVYSTFGPIHGSVEDNVLTLRGALLGGGVCLDSALVRYRQNPNSLSNWLFARGERSVDAFRKRYQRTSAMYVAIADDLANCLSILPSIKPLDGKAAERIVSMYRLEAEARTAILDKPRWQWLSPIWRGLLQPGMRRKSLERSLKLILPKRFFGMRSS